MNYYNEHDPRAAAWLRELVNQGHIAPGIVDERSIADVRPSDLAGFTQCHFFAGIGVWSYALRRAGWPDDRRVWTGSCPCQPFSDAGQGNGFADERHLWPVWFQLIAQCQPATVFGEQVASKDGLNWFDLVHADLEAAGYAVGAADLCAAGVGAPHIRQRLWFVADAQQHGVCRQPGSLDPAQTGAGHWEHRDDLVSSRHPGRVADADHRPGREGRPVVRGWAGRGAAGPRAGLGGGGVLGGLADDSSTRLEGCDAGAVGRERTAAERGGGAGGLGHPKPVYGAQGPAASHGEPQTDGPADRLGGSGVSPERLANPHDERLPAAAQPGFHNVQSDAESCGGPGGLADPAVQRRAGDERAQPGISGGLHLAGSSGSPAGPRPGPTNGHWGAADWIACRDGRWRAVEPGAFPLAHGAPARVGRLRGFGNAIVAQAAQAFIESTGLI